MVVISCHVRADVDHADDCRSAEYDQTQAGVSRVKQWAGLGDDVMFSEVKQWAELGDDDVMISASVDEILDRAVLSQLRWCELASDVTFGALWMPMGRFDNVSLVIPDI